MPIQKLQLKGGIDREQTPYTSEGGWYDGDKIRFRQGAPEKIGGWKQISGTTFLGVCRSLWNWTTLGSLNLLGVGTNLKFYIESGGAYNDITPLRATVALTDPFETTSGSPYVTVTDAAGGYIDGDFVTFSGATAVGGLTINGEYQLTYTGGSTYVIDAGANASSSATGGGSVSAAYQINVGPAYVVPLTGWGASGWGSGTWGVGSTSTDSVRVWSQANFGEDLIFGPRGGGIYLWDATSGLSSRATLLSAESGASDVPTDQNIILISDTSRFVFAFGCNDIGTATVDPMLVRWSDQEDATNWTPASTNQSGSIRLSRGTEIVAAVQSRQEILVWTNAAVYSMQYLGAPEVWGVQLIGENISITSQNSVAYANGVAYWMGIDKFYMYDGRVQTLPCAVRQYVFNNINELQYEQVFSGTNEAFNEVWWFYCTGENVDIGNYVVYNYLENIWYYGTMARTAWFDTGLRTRPLAATYSNNIVEHELGTDNIETLPAQPIAAYITSAEFDLDDGHSFNFVWRVLPDVTFRGSEATNPSITFGMLPMANSGAGYNNPKSVGGTDNAAVTRSSTYEVEQFTGQIYTRVRGRQMAIKISSSDLGVAWQLGQPRLDMRPDGRR